MQRKEVEPTTSQAAVECVKATDALITLHHTQCLFLASKKDEAAIQKCTQSANALWNKIKHCNKAFNEAAEAREAQVTPAKTTKSLW